MQLSRFRKSRLGFALLLTAAWCLPAQETATPAKDAKPDLAQGLPPRISPSEYQSQTKVGNITIAADFVGHSVPIPKGPLTTEDFVAVETGLYGPADARLQISLEDFTLKINGKKNTLRAEPYGMVVSSLKDPEYVPPESAAASKGSKTSIGTGGGGQNDPGSPPPIVHIPIEVQRAMAKNTQKASLPLGDRPLPQAGVLFFQYRGKTSKITSLELVYSGPAGKVTLALKP